ncbi:MAG: lipoprotein-releasing system ATP-binding protein LolD [Verrucomicrobia bacterium]|nr:lipoprotein-releasing system ATP-binding protein LolD [Verrucomicrobiota bacterium]
MIRVKNIKKSFDHLEVLKGVDLEIQKGEIVSITGSSGAGKTTLLQIMGTLMQADQGEVLYNDRNLSGLNSNKLAAFRNQNIGFIFQFHQLLAEFNAIENVGLAAMIGGKSKSVAFAEAEKLLLKLGLKDRLLHKPSELSGGEQQRVATARALINQPQVVFADEPSGNLDSKNAQELHQLFFDLRKESNQTFVIVTHNEELAMMCDRQLHMVDGIITK